MTTLHTERLTLTIADRNLCQGLDVEFKAGENWVILGANGSGKTTLLHALAGLRAPDQGLAMLDGVPVGQIPHRLRARRMGVLFQDFNSEFPATVLETVLTGRYPRLERWQWESAADYQAAAAALDAVGLAGFAHRSLTTLSGGERRRVDIAALLAQDAPICFMDEPTNHLDLRHQTQILELLSMRSDRPGHFNVFVLHDINLAVRFGSHGIMLFDDGENLCGPLPSIIKRPNLERLYHCRLREIRSDGFLWYFPD